MPKTGESAESRRARMIKELEKGAAQTVGGLDLFGSQSAMNRAARERFDQLRRVLVGDSGPSNAVEENFNQLMRREAARQQQQQMTHTAPPPAQSDPLGALVRGPLSTIGGPGDLLASASPGAFAALSAMSGGTPPVTTGLLAQGLGFKPSSDNPGDMALELASGLLGDPTNALFAAGPLAVKVAGKAKRMSKAERELLKARELLAKHETTTARRVANMTNSPAGGYSVSLQTGEVPTSGIMAGRFANNDPHNSVIPGRLMPSAVEQHVARNLTPLAQKDMHLGSWVDNGTTYLDASRRFPAGAVRPATKYGEKTGQLAIYDIDNQKSLPVGNWESFVRGPEYQQRLDELAGEGRSYLSQHPASEWWDMHGSSFERVYGTDRLPQVAGFTAATAPVSAPRENLQTMSEYMRRQIKEEPIIQPDWRVPPGQMTRKEGKRMPMETGRRRNLVAASEGRLEDLRKDKVREEARAMMGDPSAVVLDRHQVRATEAPDRGIFANSTPDTLTDHGYGVVKEEISRAAVRNKRDPRDYSADVWTGIRERIKKTSDLFGMPFKGSAITGDSKSYADIFDDLIRDKAAHLKISVKEMEDRLAKGDATLLSYILATPIGAKMYSEWQAEQDQRPSGLLF